MGVCKYYMIKRFKCQFRGTKHMRSEFCKNAGYPRPAGYNIEAIRKNEHGYTVGTRADEGIGPYK